MILTVEELKRLKDAGHYSYREISERSGVPLGTVQKVLGGITASPRRDTLEALSNVLLKETMTGAGIISESSHAYSVRADKDRADRSDNSSRQGISYRTMLDKGTIAGGFDDDPVERLLDTKRSGEFTVDDYYVISEKYRIELIDGEIYDMAAPDFLHQHIAGLIYYQMMSFRLRNNETCIPAIAPMDVQLDRDDKTMVQPDMIVFCDKKKNLNNKIYGAPDLVLEVLSPSTRYKDRIRKRDKYRAAGCREYWMVDPVSQRVTVLDFEGNLDGVYTFDQTVPVRISGGRCRIDFRMIKNELMNLGEM